MSQTLANMHAPISLNFYNFYNISDASTETGCSESMHRDTN